MTLLEFYKRRKVNAKWKYWIQLPFPLWAAIMFLPTDSPQSVWQSKRELHMDRTPEKLVQEEKEEKNITNRLNIVKTHSFPSWPKESPQNYSIFTLNSFKNNLIPLPPPQHMMQAKEQNESFLSVFTLLRFSFMHTPAWCRCDFSPDR